VTKVSPKALTESENNNSFSLSVEQSVLVCVVAAILIIILICRHLWSVLKKRKEGKVIHILLKANKIICLRHWLAICPRMWLANLTQLNSYHILIYL
jgi:nitrogen fixation/metabolism regulation signal transduction histidine kinase